MSSLLWPYASRTLRASCFCWFFVVAVVALKTAALRSFVIVAPVLPVVAVVVIPGVVVLLLLPASELCVVAVLTVPQ